MGFGRVMRVTGVGIALSVVALTGCGDGGDGDVEVSLESPADGAQVAGGVPVEMSADGITIEEAGEARHGAGHFHVIVDGGCVAEGETVPKDADHVHFGQGQGEGKVYLSPGEHELCLQVADGVHRALAATDTVTVTSSIESRDEWCATVGELDVLFTETDTNGQPFPDRQIGYENAGRLIEQLDAAIEQVDAGSRADVGAALDVAMRIARAFVTGTDESTAFEEVQAVLASSGPVIAAGASWISEECNVDIDG